MVGIILAGGCSTRAKVNKLLLEVDRKPLIRHTIDTIKPFVEKVFVVTGKYHDELTKVLSDVEVVYNKDFELGMFSSVLAGAHAAVGNDVLLIPGDISNVSSSTIEALLHGNKDIRIPSYKGNTGHPVYISKKYVELLTHEPVSSRLCDFLSAHVSVKEVISVNDPFINFDIDTIEDYNRFINTRKEVTL